MPDHVHYDLEARASAVEADLATVTASVDQRIATLERRVATLEAIVTDHLNGEDNSGRPHR